MPDDLTAIQFVDDEYDDDGDRLRTAAGIINGFLLGMIFWMVVGAGVAVWFWVRG